jgi:hypothetical protein
MAKGTRGEEQKVEGPFRKLSVTLGNSKETGFQLVKTLRAFSQICQSTRARSRFLLCDGLPGPESAHHYLNLFFFFFSRALEICDKL